jgi:hypothetical protein
MNLERLLAPHLATQMPEIARFMVWLYAADILMITLTVVAVNRLGKVPAVALSSEIGRQLVGMRDGLRRVRYLIIAAVGIVTIAWMWLGVRGQLTPALVDVIFKIGYIGALWPIYFIVRLFEGAFSALHQRSASNAGRIAADE